MTGADENYIYSPDDVIHRLGVCSRTVFVLCNNCLSIVFVSIYAAKNYYCLLRQCCFLGDVQLGGNPKRVGNFTRYSPLSSHFSWVK